MCNKKQSKKILPKIEVSKGQKGKEIIVKFQEKPQLEIRQGLRLIDFSFSRINQHWRAPFTPQRMDQVENLFKK